MALSRFARQHVATQRERRAGEKLANAVVLRREFPNNYLAPTHQPVVRCRAKNSTSGPISAASRCTHPKNPQCGN